MAAAPREMRGYMFVRADGTARYNEAASDEDARETLAYLLDEDAQRSRRRFGSVSHWTERWVSEAARRLQGWRNTGLEVDGVSIYVQSHADVTRLVLPHSIQYLGTCAAADGDHETAELCRRALEGDPEAYEAAAARMPCHD